MEHVEAINILNMRKAEMEEEFRRYRQKLKFRTPSLQKQQAFNELVKKISSIEHTINFLKSIR